MMPNQRVASPAPGPVKTSTSVLIVLFGLWLVAGAVYQVVLSKWFLLFPIQIDGVFDIFEWLIGHGAGIYVSSLVAGAFGMVALWAGIMGIKTGMTIRAGHPVNNSGGG